MLIILSENPLYYALGGDLASTWVAKLEVHAEEVTILAKNVTKVILANKKRKTAVNDTAFAGDLAEAA